VGSGADLFVVCKQCGSEVSPYVTECPYCGHRLRRRAPKLPRMQSDAGGGTRRGGIGTLLGRSRSGGRTRPAPRAVRTRSSRWAVTRPYATIALVAVSIGMWVAIRADQPNHVPRLLFDTIVAGPLHGDWWRIFTYQFVYFEGGGAGVYAFIAVLATGLFGWLLERRHGPVVVLGLFLGAGAAGALAAEAVYAAPIMAGANAGALALVAAWAAPDLRSLRRGEFYEGDLLGAGAFAALLLAIPFARPEASWLAGVIGGLLGLVTGLGLASMAESES
jgi:hypothetical protein